MPTGAYIKHVGGGETWIFHGPVFFSENISWPLSSILVSHRKEVLTVIFKFQITKQFNIPIIIKE